ncbi:MAG: glycosyltransferase family 4 protein [Muribaculum sp.]|nr:glycosyltransferase family 4 protein [Muribaculum sp.]
MERVLWVNPSFLDYRIPLYGEINRKLAGKFHLLYSKQRIPDRCHNRIRLVLGENAHYIEHERILRFGKPSAEFANSSVSIPIPTGLYGKIKSVKPDIIIAEGYFQFTPWALVYSFLHRIPLYIAYERTAHTERNCPYWRKIYRRIIGLFVKGYIANGILTKEYLISQGVNPNSIITGGMCADSELLRTLSSEMSDAKKKKFRENVGLSECEGIRYIYVGQIIERKGVKHLLKAWEEHSKYFLYDELLIVGDGSLLNLYKYEFGSIPSIKFIGGVDYSLIYKFYSISDVFVIPTLEDNWSLVVPEAMSCGLPIACSIYNGCHPELVQKDVNGITFDTLSKDSILEALKYFHEIDLNKFGANSREIESSYNPEKTADNVIRLLRTTRIN